MPAFTIDVLLATLVAAAGVGAGWWLRSLIQKANANAQQRNTIEVPGTQLNKISREVLVQLYDVAQGMQTSVGQHRSDVQKISDELASSGGSEKEEVVTAVSKLLEANQRMQAQLEAAEERLNEQEKQLVSHAHEARTDALTKLSNRRVFDDELNAAHERFQQTSEPMTLMLLDVDHFKKFNDTHGHQAGDEVLRGVGRLMRENADDGDIPIRYGGEEFGIIYPSRKIEQVRKRAEQVRTAIADESFHFEGVELQVTASGGMAELQRGEDVPSFVKRADEALYASKEAGRNCSHWHDGSGCFQLTSESSTAANQQLDARQPALAPLEPCSRTEFAQDVERRLVERQRGGEPASVVLVQIDSFERIMSSRGDEAGQLVLRATRQFIRAIMGDMDHVAPYENDTLGMLLPGSELVDAVQTVERLRFAIERCKLPIGSSHMRFTVSIGVAQTMHDESSDDLLKRAESARDEAQVAGGNCAFYHDGEKSEHASALQTALS